MDDDPTDQEPEITGHPFRPHPLQPEVCGFQGRDGFACGFDRDRHAETDDVEAAQLRTEIANLRTEIADLQGQVSDIDDREERKDLREQIADLKDELEGKLDELEEQ
jgi:peptidoglycan hydrolase CwlO-like protein